MKTVKYNCDACKKVLSDASEGVAKTHLSIKFAEWSGWVKKHVGVYIHAASTSGIYQFCNEKCLAKHFKDMLEDVK